MPEDINRIVADHTADLLFAPTEAAVRHLRNEGLAPKSVLTGDIMADSAQFVQIQITGNKYLNRIYYLLTMHRTYNVDDEESFRMLFTSLAKLNHDLGFPFHSRPM